MAVQAQYPSNVLLLNRSEQERPATERLDQPSLFFSSSPLSIAGSGNPRRKRAREGTTGHQMMSFFGGDDACAAPKMVSLAQLHAQPATAPPLVSTGLQLAFEQAAQIHHQPSIINGGGQALSFLSEDDVAAHAKQHSDEIDRILRAHGEELRRGLAERRRREGRLLLAAAERRLREKEAEAEQAARLGAEMEGRLARLRSESLAWQAKAAADQAVAAALHAQLQQASTAARARLDEHAERGADDAHSACADPGRPEPPAAGSCRACRTRRVSAVLLPCRHLCLCGACDAAAAVCPVCGAVRSGSVHVFLP